MAKKINEIDSFEIKEQSKITNDRIIDFPLIWLFFKLNKKTILKFIIFFLIAIILIFPEYSALTISDWINDFIGTLIKQINL